MSATNVTLKGIEQIDGLWHPVVERHDPCIDPYALSHEKCDVVQRWVGPGFESKTAAIEVLEKLELYSDGVLLEGWEETGS